MVEFEMYNIKEFEFPGCMIVNKKKNLAYSN